jgi:hypothetical protein
MIPPNVRGLRRVPSPFLSMKITSPARSPILLCLVAVVSLTGTEQAQSRTFNALPVDLEVPTAPVPFRVAGKIQLLYELHITSFRIKTLELSKLEIVDDSGAVVAGASYSGDELKALMDVPGAPAGFPDNRVIGAGMRAVAYLQITSETESAIPKALRHRLYFKQDDAANRSDRMVEGGRTTVSTANRS